MPAALKYPVVVLDGVAGKVCRACESFKPLEKFSRQAGCSGGRKSLCSTCEGREAYSKFRLRSISAVRKYQKAHPEKIRFIKAATERRRHGKIAQGPGMTTAQLRALWESHRGLCAYCSAPAETNDHVIPISRGGLHEISNIVPACRDCNFRKHNKTPEEWTSSKEL